MYENFMGVWCPWRSGRLVGHLELQVVVGARDWARLQKEQPVILTAEPSLEPLPIITKCSLIY